MAVIGFIGLGNMGTPMSINLAKAGHRVRVFDLVPEFIDRVAAEGGEAAASAVEAAKGADFVITMLPAGRHVESLYIDEIALLDALDDHTVVIESSTTAPATALRVAAACNERGITMVDAPVSGGVAGAKAGTLTFIVGGSEAAYERVKPILQGMGKNILHAGDHGAGQAAKLCNNMMLGIQMIGVAESLQLGVALGLDPKVLSDIMRQSSGCNWVLELYNPYPGVMENVPAANDYQGGFLVELMCKDLGLAYEAALTSKSTTPMGGLARNLFMLHALKGNGQLDFSSIQKMFSGLD